MPNEFQSTPSSRRATRRVDAHSLRHNISIHALLAEGDMVVPRIIGLDSDFNPRPPRGGRRGCIWVVATRRYFNPRPPRGGRRQHAGGGRGGNYFNPRPPRGGRRVDGEAQYRAQLQFQSTPSSRRATLFATHFALRNPISIHALLAEGDRQQPRKGGYNREFQSTPSSRRATARLDGVLEALLFQSTPSSRRATDLLGCKPWEQGYFNPRPPRGGRPKLME